MLASETQPARGRSRSRRSSRPPTCPGGVVNILTGAKAEVGPWLAAHGDVDTIDVTGAADDLAARWNGAAADDVKRVVRPLGRDVDWWDGGGESPYAVHGDDGAQDRLAPEGRVSVQARIDVVAFDGDDTLWHNEALFSMTQERFRALLAGTVTPTSSTRVCSRPSARTSRCTATA